MRCSHPHRTQHALRFKYTCSEMFLFASRPRAFAHTHTVYASAIVQTSRWHTARTPLAHTHIVFCFRRSARACDHINTPLRPIKNNIQQVAPVSERVCVCVDPPYHRVNVRARRECVGSSGHQPLSGMHASPLRARPRACYMFTLYTQQQHAARCDVGGLGAAASFVMGARLSD